MTRNVSLHNTLEVDSGVLLGFVDTAFSALEIMFGSILRIAYQVHLTAYANANCNTSGLIMFSCDMGTLKVWAFYEKSMRVEWFLTTLRWSWTWLSESFSWGFSCLSCLISFTRWYSSSASHVSLVTRCCSSMSLADGIIIGLIPLLWRGVDPQLLSQSARFQVQCRTRPDVDYESRSVCGFPRCVLLCTWPKPKLGSDFGISTCAYLRESLKSSLK